MVFGRQSTGLVPNLRRVAAPIRVELAESRSVTHLETLWSDLATRALEPNVFLDPAFALPLMQHDGFGGLTHFLLAWDEEGPGGSLRLTGLLPVKLPSKLQLLGRGMVWGVHHEQAALGLPLLDKERAIEVFEAMLRKLHEREHRLNSLVLTQIPAKGPFLTAWLAHCAETGRRTIALDEHRRAVLGQRPRDRIGNIVSLPSGKRQKELRRKTRRLQDLGEVVYRKATTPVAIRRAAEQFLALEASGWKGRRRTALLSRPSLATFARTMTRLMGYKGNCRIDSLEIGGKPVAMGIVLMAGPRAFFWKTAFDESIAHLSPGVQFVHALTQVQEEGPWTMTDSCAVPDHPMIGHIWKDNAAIGDYLIELGTPLDPVAGFETSIRVETGRRSLRQTLKSAVKSAVRRIFAVVRLVSLRKRRPAA